MCSTFNQTNITRTISVQQASHKELTGLMENSEYDKHHIHRHFFFQESLQKKHGPKQKHSDGSVSLSFTDRTDGVCNYKQ